MKKHNWIVNLVFFILVLLVGCEEDITTTERIGLEDPSFVNGSGDWIPQARIDMGYIWQSEGINWEGYNYFFVANAKSPNKCSERFNPNSDYFQSWFGMYTVFDKANEKYALEDGELDEIKIINLAIADQKAWLKNFAGLDTHNVYIDTNVNITKEDISIDSHGGWKISGRLVSNVDVGTNNNSDLPELLYAPPAIWEENVESYQKIYLDVFAYVWYTPENKELNVAYFNGVEYESKDGTTYRTTEKIYSVLEEMIFKITVYK